MTEWRIGEYKLPGFIPRAWGLSAVAAYIQYLDERDYDIAHNIKPATDEVQPWAMFLYEYLQAELESVEV